jgi:hypothetical protein
VILVFLHLTNFNEIIPEKFFSLGNETDIQVQEAHKASNRHNHKRTSSGHIIIKLSKVPTQKEYSKNIKRMCQIIFKGASIRLKQISQQKSYEPGGNGMTFQILKENYCQLRLLCPAKISFKNEGEIKTFRDKQKEREFIATRLVLENKFKRILHLKGKER